MLHKPLLFILSLLSVLSGNLGAMPFSYTQHLQWKGVQTLHLTKTDSVQRLFLEGGVYNGLEPIPYFFKEFPVYSEDIDVSAKIVNAKFLAASNEESIVLTRAGFNDTDFDITATVTVSRKQPFVAVKIKPVRRNVSTGTFEKLVDFDIELEITGKLSSGSRETAYADHSVLKSGNWYKLRVDTTGLFKLTWDDLNAMGFDMSGNPENFALFGNGGGILPEKNDDPRPDDLKQIPLEMFDGNDGSFDPGDYMIFYAEGPVVVRYSPFSGRFTHENNYYDDYSYLFLTKLNEPGLRITPAEEASGNANEDITTFSDYSWHEIDKENLGATGRTWYGEIFDFQLKQDFVFHFPNVVSEPDAYIKVQMASRAYSSNSVLLSVNDVLQKTLPMPATLNNGYEFGRKRGTDFTFTPKSDDIKLTIEYRRSSSTSVGYLDYIDINVKRKLIFTGGQMTFTNVFSAPESVRYRLQSSEDVTVWDISDLNNVRKVKTQRSGNTLTFTADVEGVKKYMAFDGSLFYKPEFIEQIANQDLHAVKNIDYLIVTHPDFMAQAEKLADYHKEKDGMKVYVTTPEKIYNEFSSGSQDITAIRDFVKMIYDKSDAGRELKYLLLFGDASYDYKDRLSDNTNFVPCWESVKSLNIVTSIASDDYYGYLDNGEGNGDNDRVDIGIGRLPVTTAEEADLAVNKIIHYDTPSEKVMGPWRNEITFLADDEDNNHHLGDAETLSALVNSTVPEYNINKIYVDAYEQISTPGGQRAPDVNRAINSKIDHGTLIFNYSGHGGEIGLGHERFMQIADIQSWTNYDHLTVFITATCEFTRYDDPSRTSAGELVFLNPDGGGIALFTTARATYASSNLALNMAIYNNNMFAKEGGEFPCFGDIIRRSKVLGGDNDKKFVLIGDPALKMAYPELQVQTVEVNGNAVSMETPDTLRALQKVTVRGIITDDDGNKQTGYNGMIYSTVFDKQAAIQTLGTDEASQPTTFYMWKNVLFKGKAPIVNGEFSFEFVMPKDIAYNYGIGRISYYFTNDSVDGHGYYENLIIGGFYEDAAVDETGPVINLFMNDVSFKPGDITDENPVLLALVSDESGINTTGNGIGHDIIAKIDDDPNMTFNLNEFYEASEGDYKQGTITYPFKDLPDGEHTLSLKVWDIYNNSSMATLPFIVTASEDFVITALFNRPNPVTDHTEFIFEHNQPGKDLDVEIRVYSLNGELVKTMHTIVNSGSYQSPPMRWDCITDNNRKIGRGIYVYSLKAVTPEGKTAVKRSKLVFLR